MECNLQGTLLKKLRVVPPAQRFKATTFGMFD